LRGDSDFIRLFLFVISYADDDDTVAAVVIVNQSSSMGSERTLQYLTNGSTYRRYFMDFDWPFEWILLDAADLFHECARYHAKQYLDVNYLSSVVSFYPMLIYLVSILRWNICVVFDGADSPFEAMTHEHHSYLREAVKEAGNQSEAIQNDGIYIALCAKVCHEPQVHYIIAPEEADRQCLAVHFYGKPPTVNITGD
jgi:hypothetical protein